MLFEPPPLSDDDHRVITEIDDVRTQLRRQLRTPRRWQGQLRRTLKARAVQGSNSIEGYRVSLDDAIALLDYDEPQDADHRTSLEIVGYRNALTYIHQLADAPNFAFQELLLQSLHFMLLGHDLSKSPGRYRTNAIYVYSEAADEVVYEGPPHGEVPPLMAEFMAYLGEPCTCPTLVRAAMAHLNLVMIHPYRDGNGRMARALQTLVLAREQVLEPEFSSIEEWLGRNTLAYYAVLAAVGRAEWSPSADTGLWVRFNLVGHHMQAQTVLRRVMDAELMWDEIDTMVVRHSLPDRVGHAAFDALMGLHVRRSRYARQAGLEDRTAIRDLRFLVDAGLLAARGETRSRVYEAGEQLRVIRERLSRDRIPLVNPYTGAPQSRVDMRIWASGR